MSAFNKWFVAQHGSRHRSMNQSDDDLRRMMSAGLAAADELRWREMRDDDG